MDHYKLLAVALVIAYLFASPSSAGGAGVESETVKSIRPSAAIQHDVTPLALTAPPLPASPATGTLEAGVDDDDVFAVQLSAGQRFRAELAGPVGTDIDLYMLWPGSGSLLDPYAASAFSQAYPEVLEFDAPVTGTYLLDIYCSSGGGPYTLSHSIAPAKASGRVDRQYGEDRFGTALAISRSTFPGGSSEDVVLASGLKYPDALAASALAGALGCPLLITHDLTLSRGVLAEVQRIGAKEVHIVGGPVSVSDAIRGALRAKGLTVSRYAGRDRYATARVVAAAVRELTPTSGGAAFLASGEVFADALSASPIAYRWALPILLTQTRGLSPDSRAAIESHGISTVYIAGGPAAVSDPVSAELRSMGIDVVRVGGRDRYETATMLGDYAIARHWADPAYVGIASGVTFPDALTGGAAAGAHGGVVVLSPTSALGSKPRAFLGSWKKRGLVDDAVMYGGPAALTSSVERELKGLLAP